MSTDHDDVRRIDLGRMIPTGEGREISAREMTVEDLFAHALVVAEQRITDLHRQPDDQSEFESTVRGMSADELDAIEARITSEFAAREAAFEETVAFFRRASDLMQRYPKASNLGEVAAMSGEFDSL